MFKVKSHLRPDTLLQQAQGAVLPVTRGGDQLNVRVWDRGVEGFREEGRLPHRHLATRPNVQETVTHLKSGLSQVYTCTVQCPDLEGE